ncbi:MAG TPA: arginine--tRNA ligase [Kofleriaceae bacterium]|jgi:arginyl-tRNA synthetase
MPQHWTPIHKAVADAVAQAAGADPSDVKLETPKRAEQGDLAVGCFQLAKAAGKNPAALAASIAAAFQPTELLASCEATGPFVNFRIQRAAAFAWLHGAASLLPATYGAAQTVCIDYGSPNIAKHLAYHHIRGTTIGHSLAQIYRALGYRVVGINFLGDWGTTHGMVIAAYKKWGAEEPLDVKALTGLYVRWRAAAKADPALDAEGRQTFKLLEAGDVATRELWQKFRDVSWAEFDEVYGILGIEYDEVRGESAYEPDLPRVVAELADKGLLSKSEGADVVQLEGEKVPFMVRTSDGTTLYATRDYAAAEYRWETYHFTRSLYVVDRGQAEHFRKLFKTLALAGHDWASRCEHVPYGVVRIGGVKTASRVGNVVLMRDVFRIAEDLIAETIAEKNPDLAPEQRAEVARQVGIGAIVFGNLAPQRDKDIDFNLDDAVRIDGDSGPYLQYSHARCASLVRKQAASGGAPDFSKLAHDAEWAIARRIWAFPEIVVRAADAAEPHVVCHYLLDLAGDFSRWYTLGNGDPALRILSDDAALQGARIALAKTVQRVLRDGLALLGMGAPDEM